MAVYKDGKTNTWRVIFRYTDFNGEKKQTQKRGFKTKKEAQEWEREMLLQKGKRLDMTMESFYQLYERDRRGRIKASTWDTKDHIVRTKILPYFGSRKMCDITVKDVIDWQNKLLNTVTPDGKKYSPDYLRTVHAQLTAIFNHAVNYYNLPRNPARQAGNIGKEIPREMNFWTKEDYLKFVEEVMNKPVSYYAFEVLYWCGIREGELLALTPEDIDLENHILSISKTYHRRKGQDVITDPKTAKSKRRITMPEFLCEELKDYLNMIYDAKAGSRLFPVTKNYLRAELNRGTVAAGLKKIRVHDLRHSHVSLLIDMGFSALAIAERVGHETIDITYRYAHLFPSVQNEMADKLNMQRNGGDYES